MANQSPFTREEIAGWLKQRVDKDNSTEFFVELVDGATKAAKARYEWLESAGGPGMLVILMELTKMVRASHGNHEPLPVIDANIVQVVLAMEAMAELIFNKMLDEKLEGKS